MGVAEVLVPAGGVLLVAFLAWFFFGPKEARRAELRGGVQEVEIIVKGGYSPDLIRVKEDVPLRLIFDRQDNSDCTSRVVFRTSRRASRSKPSARPLWSSSRTKPVSLVSPAG